MRQTIPLSRIRSQIAQFVPIPAFRVASMLPLPGEQGLNRRPQYVPRLPEIFAEEPSPALYGALFECAGEVTAGKASHGIPARGRGVRPLHHLASRHFAVLSAKRFAKKVTTWGMGCQGLRNSMSRRSLGDYLGADDYGSGAGVDFEAVDAVTEGEGASDGGVGIAGEEEVLDEKVEGAAFDRHARDLDGLEVDGGGAAGGVDSSGHAHGPLSVEESAEEESGRLAPGAAEFAEVDQRLSGCDPVAERQAGVAYSFADLAGHFMGDIGVEFGGREIDAAAGRKATGFDEIELAAGGVVVADGCGEAERHQEKQAVLHIPLDAGEGGGVAPPRPVVGGKGAEGAVQGWRLTAW
jgi:hypothetical protein